MATTEKKSRFSNLFTSRNKLKPAEATVVTISEPILTPNEQTQRQVSEVASTRAQPTPPRLSAEVTTPRPSPPEPRVRSKSQNKVSALFQPRPSDVFIGLMGMTGVGKSTFASLCSEEKVNVGHGLGSCTQDVSLFTYEYSPSTTVYLVDTPGFDDDRRPDSEVLMELASWLTASYASQIKLNGIIYFHRITDNKLGGSAKNNLVMFKKLCGADAFSNVILATTMWELVDPAVGEQREAELKERDDFWGFMISRGSQVVRHMNTRESALQLISSYASKESKIAPKPLDIQVDIVDRGMSLEQTGAGKEVEIALAREKALLERELAEQKESIERLLKEKDQAAAKRMQDHQKETNARIQSLSTQSAELKSNLEKVHREQYAKLETSLSRAQKDNAKVREDLERAERQHKESLSQVAEHRAAALREKENARRGMKDLEERIQSSKDAAKEAANAAEKRQEELEEKINLLSIKAGSEAPFKPRRGVNRINEYVSVTLKGSEYYFCGPTNDAWRMPDSFDEEVDGSLQYVELGIKGTWYKHWHDLEGEERTQHNNLSVYYPKLATWLDRHEECDCPDHITLGEDGYCFVRFGNKRYWYLPNVIIDRIGKDDMHSVQYLWLGKNDTYVAVLKSGRKVWDMKGLYGSLGDKVRETKSPLRALALNLDNGNSYCAIWEDATVSYRANGAYEPYQLKSFTAKNFGSKW